MKTIAIFIVCDIILTHGSPLNSEIMDINSEPGKPYIMQAMEEEMMEVQEGEEVELQCESQGGRPPAEIQWWDGVGRRIVSDVTEHVKRMEDTKMFKTVSTVIIKSSEIQWWDGEGRRIVSDVTEHVKRMEDTNMF